MSLQSIIEELRLAQKAFDPNQARDDHGRWTGGSSSLGDWTITPNGKLMHSNGTSMDLPPSGRQWVLQDRNGTITASDGTYSFPVPNADGSDDAERHSELQDQLNDEHANIIDIHDKIKEHLDAIKQMQSAMQERLGALAELKDKLGEHVGSANDALDELDDGSTSQVVQDADDLHGNLGNYLSHMEEANDFLDNATESHHTLQQSIDKAVDEA